MCNSVLVNIRTKVTSIIIVILSRPGNCDYQEKEKGTIYILNWPPDAYEPFNFVDVGKNAFKNCTYKNCFLTSNRTYLKDILDFDVLMFNIINLQEIKLPPKRSIKQKYCLYGLDSAGYHLITEKFNGYFNITFTYKLSSNVTIPYIVIKDENGNVIGPKTDMRWKKLDEMNETNDYVKNKLKNKTIAAAWIVSHCETPFRRLYAENLQIELEKLGHYLDIYGKCGTKSCPTGSYGLCGNYMCPRYERMDECLAIVESDYYFYIAFENSFGEDYVTEKILHGLEHFAVPVVLGKANYTRFMPEGIYLNANSYRPDKLAEKMNQLIENQKEYNEFFRWHDHYTFQFSGEDRYSREMCNLCAFLNESANKTSVYENITGWWNEPWPEWPPDTPMPSVQVPVDEPNSVEKFFRYVFSFLE